MEEQDQVVDTPQEPVSETGVTTGSDPTGGDTSGQNATDAGKSGQQSTGTSSFPSEAIDEITRLRSRSRTQEEARIRAEVERDLLRRELEGRQSQPIPQAVPEPKPEDFSDPDTYRQAQFNWAVKTEVSRTLAEERQASERQTQQQQTKSLVDQYRARQDKLVEANPDFITPIKDPYVPMSEAMVQAVLTSDVGPEIYNYLATHRDEAARLSTSLPGAAARAIGVIEAKLGQGDTTRTATGKPPPPFNPVTGHTRIDTPVEKLSMEEYAAKWEQDRAAGRI